jgi:hypothetical protein
MAIAASAWLRVRTRPGSQVTVQPLPASAAVCGVQDEQINLSVTVRLLSAILPDSGFIIDDGDHPAGLNEAGVSRLLRAGQVPGIPAGQPGEMQYTVTRAPGGQLLGDMLVVLDVAGGRDALVRSIGQVETETQYLLEPQASGTRLTLANRYFRPVPEARQNLLRDSTVEFAGRYKTLIEESGRQKAPLSPPAL